MATGSFRPKAAIRERRLMTMAVDVQASAVPCLLKPGSQLETMIQPAQVTTAMTLAPLNLFSMGQ
jgi:hypothetical protein